MIYHWRIKHGSWPKCYINAWVPSPDELVQGGKNYAAEGDVTAIEIWKLSNPDPELFRMMSWNTPRATFTHGHGQFHESLCPK